MIIEKKYVGSELHNKNIVIPSFEVSSLSGNELSFDKFKINNDGTFTISIISTADFEIYQLAKKNKIDIERFTDFNSIHSVTLSIEEIEQILLRIIEVKK